MDISDVEGDKESGVRTLPVLLGRQASLGLAVLLLTAGVGAAGAGILSGTFRFLSGKGRREWGGGGVVG